MRTVHLICMSSDALDSTSEVIASFSLAAQLPPYCAVFDPSFMWGKVNGTDFMWQICRSMMLLCTGILTCFLFIL